MSLPNSFLNRLSLPVVAAPMFLVSGPEIVISCCKAGIVGTFPALNQRSTEGLNEWIEQIKDSTDDNDSPFGINLIVHKIYMINFNNNQ